MEISVGNVVLKVSLMFYKELKKGLGSDSIGQSSNLRIAVAFQFGEILKTPLGFSLALHFHFLCFSLDFNYSRTELIYLDDSYAFWVFTNCLLTSGRISLRHRLLLQSTYVSSIFIKCFCLMYILFVLTFSFVHSLYP